MVKRLLLSGFAQTPLSRGRSENAIAYLAGGGDTPIAHPSTAGFVAGSEYTRANPGWMSLAWLRHHPAPGTAGVV